MLKKLAAPLFCLLSMFLLLGVAYLCSQVKKEVLVCNDERGLLFIGTQEVFDKYKERGFLPRSESFTCVPKTLTMEEWGLMSRHLRRVHP